MVERLRFDEMEGNAQRRLAGAGGNPDVAQRSNAAIAHSLGSIDWDFRLDDTGHSNHGLFPYPAKFPPQIPEVVIAELTRPGDLVVDCFSGSGTTAVEALRSGRRSWSIDANPVGVLFADVKTSGLSSQDHQTLSQFLHLVTPESVEAEAENAWIPPIPNMEKWYDKDLSLELAGIRELIIRHLEAVPLKVALSVFINVAARLSFQDSETRYVSRPRPVVLGSGITQFKAGLRSASDALVGNVTDAVLRKSLCADARDRSAWPENGSAALIVTSPPYPNSYDYHLYHRFRLFWLGDGPSGLRSIEIGSHLKNQSAADPIGDFERDMTQVMSHALKSLRPGGFAVFVVGDGKFGGEIYSTSTHMGLIAESIGLEVVSTIDRNLPDSKRSVTSAGRRLTSEQVCVFRSPSAGSSTRIPPTYQTYEYEEHLAALETNALTGVPHGLRQAAFTHAWEGEPTLQHLSERDPASTGKNSTYGPHGIHRYKGKFYPQLAKSLINVARPYSGLGLVCDPFGGSGTVATEAVLAGLDVLSLDISPLATQIARTKVDLLSLSSEEFANSSSRLLESLSRKRPIRVNWAAFPDDIRDEAESWFAPRVLAKLSTLLIELDRSDVNPTIASAWRVVTSDIIRQISHQDPKDLRIRRRKDPLDDAPVFDIFGERLLKLVRKRSALDARLAAGPLLGTAEIVNASAEDFVPIAGGCISDRPISAVVSSPPYGVALPYLDTDRLSLALVCGYSRPLRKELEERLIGSREITRGVAKSLEQELALTEELPESTKQFLTLLSEAVAGDPSAGFRKQNLPSVLTRYFLGMSRVLRQMSVRMLGGSEASLVLGDSTSTIGGRRWVIPTVDEVASIAKFHGFSLVERIPISVTREALRNSRHAITDNDILRLHRDA